MYKCIGRSPGSEHLTAEAFHEAGTVAARASYAVKKAAYDHVRSGAESGVPFTREYCSDIEPSRGVYFCCRVMSFSVEMTVERTYHDRHITVGVSHDRSKNYGKGCV